MTNKVPMSSKSYLSVHSLITEQILYWISLKIKDVQHGRDLSDISTRKATLQDQENSRVLECGVFDNWYEF